MHSISRRQQGRSGSDPAVRSILAALVAGRSSTVGSDARPSSRVKPRTRRDSFVGARLCGRKRGPSCPSLPRGDFNVWLNRETKRRPRSRPASGSGRPDLERLDAAARCCRSSRSAADQWECRLLSDPGPTLVIEYAPQRGTNHIHTIIRDPPAGQGLKRDRHGARRVKARTSGATSARHNRDAGPFALNNAADDHNSTVLWTAKLKQVEVENNPPPYQSCDQSTVLSEVGHPFLR
jgi:hypothetical protein